MDKPLQVPESILDQILRKMLINLKFYEEFDANMIEKLGRLIELGYMSSEEQVTKLMKINVDELDENN